MNCLLQVLVLFFKAVDPIVPRGENGSSFDWYVASASLDLPKVLDSHAAFFIHRQDLTGLAVRRSYDEALEIPIGV